MMTLIRNAGHSVTPSRQSTPTNVILHGKRADTGDTWVASFGIEDAKRAGLLSRGNYQKYGQDMFTWRALSRLARFLFPDVIKGCYVRGEISDAPGFDEAVDEELEQKYAEAVEVEIYGAPQTKGTEGTKDTISAEQVEEIESLIGDDKAYRNQVLQYLMKSFNVKSFNDLTPELYERIKARATQRLEQQPKAQEA